MKINLIFALCSTLALTTPVAAQPDSIIPIDNFEAPQTDFKLNLGQEFKGAQGSLTRDETVAHSGRASARLQADFSGGGVYVAMGASFPVPIELKEVSFWIKSTDAKSLRFRLTDGTGQVHQKFVPFEPNGQWQQVKVTEFNAGDAYMHWGGANDGQWHQPAKGLDLILEKGNLVGKPQGTVWIDDIEALGAQRETLTLKLNEDKLGNVFLANEPIRFSVASNATAVQWTAHDFLDKPVAEGTAPIKDNQAKIAIPGHRPGYFTLHLAATKPNATTENAETSFAVLTPFDMSGVSRSPFGVMTHFAQNWNPDIIPLIALAGAAHDRDELYWDHVEPTPDHFEFAPEYESYMGQFKQQQIMPLIPLTFENKNYDGGQTPYTEAGFDAYARYAQAVLQHYGPQIKAVEIWNEYNGSFAKGPAAQDRAATYAKMLQHAYLAIKQIRPDVTVVGCSTAGVPLPFLEKVFQHGGLKYMDAISIHPYRYGSTPEGIENDLARLTALTKQYNNGQPKPIWVTEVGWFLKPSEEPGDLAITEADQGKFVVRGYSLLLSAGAEKIFWYLFRDYAEFATMGLVHSDNNPTGRYTPKPAYVAYANMTRQLSDARFVRREATLKDVYSLLFQRPGNGVPQDVRVLWALTPVTLNVKTNAPLTVVNMMGEKSALQPVGGTVQLALTDAPLYLQGPILSLPPAPPGDSAANGKIVADSELQFSNAQGKNGWQYGYYEVNGQKPNPTDFKLLPQYRVTDWKEEWFGGTQWLSITSTEQHPGVNGDHQMWSTRRWTSSVAGRVRITGELSRGTKGDGSTAHILVDGTEVFARLLGGGQSLKAQFDVMVPVRVGSLIDFAIDSGPGTNTDFDGVTIKATIAQLNELTKR